jgi:hypothetical protein
VSECDREASIMRRPRSPRGCCSMGVGRGKRDIASFVAVEDAERQSSPSTKNRHTERMRTMRNTYIVLVWKL